MKTAKQDFDPIIAKICDYVCAKLEASDCAISTARYGLMDTLGCAILALKVPACTKLLGPVVAGTVVPNGVRVPGTDHRLDPVKGAWDIGCCLRWLDFNDTWLAAEWGHPSDNLAAILAVSDHLSQSGQDLKVRDVLMAMIKAHEIQGVLALENSFNGVGLDHVLLVKVASTAVAAKLLGANRQTIMNALSHAWVDGASLRTYRHAPNTMSRKSWAAGDASARGVQLAMLCCRGESGVPSAISTKTWGFSDVLFGGRELVLQREFGCYVMENVLFKISFPAEFHAQTAVEAAIALHNKYKDKWDDLTAVHIKTHASALRIISKTGAMNNPADRDHCLQYMVAVALLEGDLKVEHYEDSYHRAHPEIDALREKMSVSEAPQYSKDYLDPSKRSIANALRLEFKGGQKTDWHEVHYPIGHRRRREEGIPKLIEKFKRNLSSRYEPSQVECISTAFGDSEKLDDCPVKDFMAWWSGS